MDTKGKEVIQRGHNEHKMALLKGSMEGQVFFRKLTQLNFCTAGGKTNLLYLEGSKRSLVMEESLLALRALLLKRPRCGFPVLFLFPK